MNSFKHRWLPAVISKVHVLAIAGLSLACTSSSAISDINQDEAVPIWLELYDWYEVTDSYLDPLFGHRPEFVSCGMAGWYVEQETIEVDTEYCNYLSLGYRLGTIVPASSRLKGAIWHFNLAAIEPSSAHVALLIDHRIVWEREVPIPSKAEIFNLDLELKAELTVGTPIMFHLHNHGENVWNFSALRFEPPSLRQ